MSYERTLIYIYIYIYTKAISINETATLFDNEGFGCCAFNVNIFFYIQRNPSKKLSPKLPFLEDKNFFVLDLVS